MRFLLDENLHVGVGTFLQGKTHDVKRVPSGIENGDVLALAITERRILLTQDKDFLDAKHHAPKKGSGVICIRIHPPILDHMVQALEQLLSNRSENELDGAIFSLDTDGSEKIA